VGGYLDDQQGDLFHIGQSSTAKHMMTSCKSAKRRGNSAGSVGGGLGKMEI
jgi:L-aminopeptidase/D-esterase-like protein